MGLIKVAISGAFATGVVYAAVYTKHQKELKTAEWFREAAVTVSRHEGVHALIGQPPFEMGGVYRFRGDKYTPLKEVEPKPLYVIEAPLKGKIGEGRMRLYLNYLVPIEVARQDINSWNVGLIEIQIGDNQDHRFIVPQINNNQDHRSIVPEINDFFSD